MSYDDIDAVYDQVEQSAKAPSVAPRRMGNQTLAELFASNTFDTYKT